MPSPKNISGQNIRKTRLSRKLESDDFCSECVSLGLDISSDELKQIEAGDYEVSDVMLETISKALEVTVTSLISGESEIKKPSNRSPHS